MNKMFEGNLNNEEFRLKTFDGVDWPHNFISPAKLAKTGFYYIGPYDQVFCYFCKVAVWLWEMGDDEVKEHSKWSPCCPLLRRRLTTNVPLEPTSDLDELLPPYSIDEVDTYDIPKLDIRPGSYSETKFPEQHRCHEPNMLCKICFVKQYNVAFMPCRHVVTCYNCAQTAICCPICRQNKEIMIRVFFS